MKKKTAGRFNFLFVFAFKEKKELKMAFFFYSPAQNKFFILEKKKNIWGPPPTTPQKTKKKSNFKILIHSSTDHAHPFKLAAPTPFSTSPDALNPIVDIVAKP